MKNLFATFRISNLTILVLSISLLHVYSCNSNNDSMDSNPIIEPEPTLVQVFQVILSAQYSIPANTTRTETGLATLSLYSDNSLEYNIVVSNLAESDILTACHIHLGDLLSAGDIAFTVVDGSSSTFTENSASGTVMLNNQQVNTLQGNNIYINIHSIELPSGLLRGSIDEEIDFAMDILLSPENETRNETGIVTLRFTASSKLYYRVTVNDLDMSDTLTDSHIHMGSIGNIGPVFKTLVVGSDNFGTAKMLSLDVDERAIFLSDDLYINVHSTQEPASLLRGQIR